MDIESLTQRTGEWLRGRGPDSDIVISSRVRLARNLARFPFLTKANRTTRQAAADELSGHLREIDVDGPLEYFDVDQLSEIDRMYLVESQLISRELADASGARGVAVGEEQNVAVMVNEEDHLRMQVLRSGFDLDDAWDYANRLDDAIESRVTYAFSGSLGYLTACPTNVGTGIRVSVMLHLPALVMTKEIQKVYTALQKINLAVRGLYGEGSQAMGDFYQISNQITLGPSETEILEKLRGIVKKTLEWERNARDKLKRERREKLLDQIKRAYATLQSAQSISTEETLQLLSSVRLGVNVGMLDEIEIPTVNELFVHTQPAHLQKLANETLDKDERDSARARYIRGKLS